MANACGLCGKGKAEIPIYDSNTEKEIWICEACDLEMFDARTLQERMATEIDAQIQQQLQYGNEGALLSLQRLRAALFSNRLRGGC